MDSVLCKI